MLTFIDEVLFHVSRGVRWDSDHVVTLSDPVRAVAEEAVRGNVLDRVHFGLDYFDASINRIAAWVIGARSLLKALLIALVEPTQTLREMELNGDRTGRLALMEELKTLPFAAVWNRYCEMQGVPAGAAWLNEVRAYERDPLSAEIAFLPPLPWEEFPVDSTPPGRAAPWQVAGRRSRSVFTHPRPNGLSGHAPACAPRAA